MLAFGCPITNGRLYERFAEPGIELVREPDSVILAHQSADSIFKAYNMFLDQAAKLDGLEALILLHQDAEIVDPEFPRKVREALSDPDVAVVGCGGARGVRNINWWDGSVTWASFVTRFEEQGGGEIPGFTWREETVPSFGQTGEVDTVDGFVMALSPWAVRELRFDESLGRLHGYDLDFCLQARAAGRKVVTSDFRVIHHHSLDLIGDQDGWIAAHMQIADKWEGSLPDYAGEDWKLRARRAEAERDAARLRVHLAEHFINDLHAEYVAMRTSRSWKTTSPLRALIRIWRRIRHSGAPAAPRLGEKTFDPRSEISPEPYDPPAAEPTTSAGHTNQPTG